ncbi:uncharacterized protein LOC106138412 [Amyelois transitella]|uniref:uncharacterized protein LOC106138412 n=1 Tax=Amyelois transitella TaxID=680683 RepID=UPI0029905511|nr:uncharacterized protein LOC106138412 [Amyelois transitella]
MWFLAVLCVFAARVFATAGYYCSVNTFTTNSSGMYFTKEPVSHEYGFEDKFKSIHCCVKGYRSIEWFKDGVAYPWSAGMSNLILYPEAANQTLYTRRASRADSGDYTCRLTNETHSETHSVRLDILDKPNDTPRTMFISPDQWLDEGEELRLFCEALVGKSYLADARSDLRWRRLLPNGTEVDLLPTHTEIKTHRDDVIDIRGVYLTVDRITRQDFGTYVCEVHSNDARTTSNVTVHDRFARLIDGGGPWRGAAPVSWRAVAGALSGAALLALSLAALRRRCCPRLQLALRQARARAATAAHHARVLEKEFDVLVCYTSVDGELVRGALLPTLSLKYKYRLNSLLLNTGPDNWYNEIMGEMSHCRSVVVVVSPAQYSAQQLLTALRQLRALPLPPVLVLLQDLPKLKREAKESGETLVELVRRSRLVPWRHVHERAFWTQLRLELPLPPPVALTQVKTSASETIEDKSQRTSSLTALV